jgi:integrase
VARRWIDWRRIVWDRLRNLEAFMKMQKQWQYRFEVWVMPTRISGVWKKREGGHLVRARVTDPTTGRQREIKRVLPEADEATAYKWLQDERARIKSAVVLVQHQKTRFADFVVSLLERKLAKKQIKSARGRERWRYTLEHLIKGTKGVAGFGELYVDQIRVGHIEEWQVGVGRLIQAGTYSPATANGWIGILKVIFKAAKRELSLASNPTEGIEAFDTSEHATYTEEEPNALTVDETRAFLACMREEFPQHYAMTFLGFATGLRPSSLRPLRRRGDTPDVRWDDGILLVRRSHTLGEEVMNSTKTGVRQRITIPVELLDVLRWHVETQLETEEQRASDLLFPREDGGFRSESSLKKAFGVVGGLIGLKKNLTPRGMRRTFNDVARVAKVESLVTKSISGHLTDRMKDHYSTVSPGEQRESIGRVLRLVRSGAPASVTASGDGASAPLLESGAEGRGGRAEGWRGR